MNAMPALNLGCGYDKRAGFLNVDVQSFHAPDVVADVTTLPLPSAGFALVVAQDILEHLERQRVPVALAEWARLLAPDGVLELRVPSLLDLLGLLAAPENRPAPRAAELVALLYARSPSRARPPYA
jgi:predicted SAM-dependent methyltransferase